MRTKNAKRLWPVPATLTVVALAAFLAFGLMATTGAQPAAAQDGADCEITIAQNGTLVASGATASDTMCDAVGDTATLTFTGPTDKNNDGTPPSTDPYTFYVLSEDKQGDLVYYPETTVYQGNRATLDQNTDTDPSDDVVRRAGFYLEAQTEAADRVSSKRYTSQVVEVGFATLQGDGFKPQKVSVTVSGDFQIYLEATVTGSFAQDVPCRVFVPNGSGMDGRISDTCNLTDGDDTNDFSTPKGSKRLIPSNGTGVGNIHSVDITFLGAPSLTQDDLAADDDNDAATADNADDDKNDDTDPSSAMAAFRAFNETAGSIAPADPSNADAQLWQLVRNEDDELVEEIPSGDSNVFIVAEVRDGDGNLLKGGSSIESAVTFNVMFHADSDLQSVARVEYSEPADVNTMGRAAIKLSGWTTSDDTGPVKVTVTAMYTGPSGTLELPEVELSRVAVPSMLNAGTYICAPLGQGEKDEANDGCPVAFNDAVLTDGDDSVPATNAVEEAVFGRGEVIIVTSELLDQLGSETPETANVTRSSDASDALTPQTAEAGATAQFMVTEDAELGTYTDGIVVSFGSGDDELEQKLTFTISGEAENFEFDMPAMYIGLATGTSQTFTITGTDENGNVPSESVMVEVVVLGVASSYVSGIGTDNMLEIKDGSASFEIFTPVDAEQGDTALILVRVDSTEVARHAVTFGDAPTAPGMPMNVMAMATSHDMITVTWDAADDGGSDITGYVLQSKTGTMDFMTIAASSAEVWWNTLDCPMMNAEIPDDATPAPPMDDTDMTSPYCAMYAGLSAEATTVVDDVFADKYDTISGTSHSDMGLMAETTYYYRVSATNSVGKGEYSDGMAMAMTMMALPMELGDTSIISAMSNAAGEATIMIMPGDNATKHYIWVQPTDRSQGMYSDEAAGDADMVTISGLTSGMNYWFTAIAGRGTGTDSEWSAWSGWTEEKSIQ